MGGKIDILDKLIEIEERVATHKPLFEGIHSTLRELLAARPVSGFHVELMGVLAKVSNIEMETFRVADSLSGIHQSLIDLEIIPRSSCN